MLANNNRIHQETPNDFIKEKVRFYLLEVCKKNHLHLISQNDFLKSYLASLGYDYRQLDFEELHLWFQNLTRLLFLEQFCQGDHIEEVIVHGPSWVQVFAKDRKEHFYEKISNEDWQLALELMTLSHKQIWNESNPFVSYQGRMFGKEWRITVAHRCLTPGKTSKVFFRHQKKSNFKLSDFSLTQGQETLIKELIRRKKNLIVCGATGSGKTSFLKALLAHTNEREHITILEDTHEITHNGPFTTNFISSQRPGTSLKDYCSYAMRMRPERIILGEVRSEEVVPFLLSINTGHSGMMASLHANSALDSLSRLSLLFQIYSGQEGLTYQDIMKMICQGVDFIIHLDQKKVTEVIEVMGCEGTTPYYKVWDQ